MALFLSMQLPGYTPKIKDSKGEIIANSVSLLETVNLGGIKQWVQIRGKDVSNPVLLWLHGGPGAAQMPVSRHFNGDLERDFIVVHWDQRGAGKSNPFNFNENTMTFEQYILDAHELTIYLKDRFNKQKIYLLGHSWGSQIGSRLAYRYPKDYYAYIGVSQVVNSNESNKIAFSWLVEKVKKSLNKKEMEKLEALGQPPFTNHEKYVKFAKTIESYGGGMDVGIGELAWIAAKSPEYRFSDYILWIKGSNRGSGPMWETTSKSDLMQEVPKILIPVYFFSGKNDYNTPLALVRKYYDKLNAPEGKELVIFEQSSHTPFMAQPQLFNDEVVRVKNETYVILD